MQKVRLLGSAQEAQTLMDELVAAMPRCQARLRAQAVADAGPLPSGETAPVPNATVVEDPQSRLDDATGSLRVYRTTSDYGTPASSRTIEWVVLAREGSDGDLRRGPQERGHPGHLRGAAPDRFPGPRPAALGARPVTTADWRA